MSKFKIVGIVALIVFTMGILLLGDALAGERGKFVARWVVYGTSFQTLKVPDVEGHTIFLTEAKGIAFSEKWGAHLIYLTGTYDIIKKGEGTVQGYNQMTFPDGSTITSKWEGKLMGRGRTVTGASSTEGTWTYIKGTGKFEGIQGVGTYKSYILGTGQWYNDMEGDYTLP